MNPVQIDTLLAELYARRAGLLNQAERFLIQAEHTYSDAKAEEFRANAEQLGAQAAEVRAEILPLEEKYTGWSRAYVVPEGHVHRSTYCSTCFPTTEFGWVTELSGSTEAEIIEAAGSRACTVCYPDAPVDAAPGRIYHATELAAQAAREERAAKKAAADAKKAANAIGPYRTSNRDNIQTVHAAKAYLTDGYEWGWNHPSYSVEDRDVLAGLLAAKNGTDVETELQAAIKRAANRG